MTEIKKQDTSLGKQIFKFITMGTTFEHPKCEIDTYHQHISIDGTSTIFYRDGASLVLYNKYVMGYSHYFKLNWEYLTDILEYADDQLLPCYLGYVFGDIHDDGQTDYAKLFCDYIHGEVSHTIDQHGSRIEFYKKGYPRLTIERTTGHILTKKEEAKEGSYKHIAVALKQLKRWHDLSSIERE